MATDGADDADDADHQISDDADNSQTRLAFGFLLFVKNWWLKLGPPGSAEEVASCGLRVASCGWVPQGSLRFPFRFAFKVPRRFREVPQGSAGFRKVPQWFS